MAFNREEQLPRVDDRVGQLDPWPPEIWKRPAESLLHDEEARDIPDVMGIPTSDDTWNTVYRQHRDQLIWRDKLYMMHPDDSPDPLVFRLFKIEEDTCYYKRIHEKLVRGSLRCVLEYHSSSAQVGDNIYIRDTTDPMDFHGPLTIVEIDGARWRKRWRVRNCSGNLYWKDRPDKFVYAGKDPTMLDEKLSTKVFYQRKYQEKKRKAISP